MAKTEHFTKKDKLREHAREHITDGSVTAGYSADLEVVLRQLNDALATEMVCVLRYRRHHFMARGIYSQSIAAEFLEHSEEEQGHADMLAARIVQLGGQPNFNPESLASRSHAQYVEGDSLLSMVQENLVAERIAIDSYRELIAYLADDDPTTRRLIEEILSVEEEHADELSDLVTGIPAEVKHKSQKAKSS